MIKCKRNYVYADMSDFTQIDLDSSYPECSSNTKSKKCIKPI